MSRWISTGVLAVAVSFLFLGCAQQQSATAAAVEEKVYTVTPAAVSVKVGIIKGELSDMKVSERVEQGSGKVVSPAKLSGMVKLKNTSADQTVRLLAGKIQYLDAQGQAIKLEDSRAEPALKFSTYGNEQLGPGQDTSQALEVEFPAEALKAKRLKDIRMELTYIPSPYREEKVDFTVSIGQSK